MFQGFEARTVGANKPVYVINDGYLADGTPAFKVRLGRYVGTTGWGSTRQQFAYDGAIGLIAKSKISRR